MTHKEKQHNSAFVCVKYALLSVCYLSLPIWLFSNLVRFFFHFEGEKKRKSRLLFLFNCDTQNIDNGYTWTTTRIRYWWEWEMLKMKTVHENIDTHTSKCMLTHEMLQCWWRWLIEISAFLIIFFVCKICLFEVFKAVASQRQAAAGIAPTQQSNTMNSCEYVCMRMREKHHGKQLD